jgi:glycosyltransferase involved in cell wall biosynthesis
VWIVGDSGTWEVALAESTDRLAGRLDSDKVSVVPIDGGPTGAVRNWVHFLRYSLQRPYGVFFLPAFLTMVPVYPLAKIFLRRSAIYLAGDYEITLRDESQKKWPGWKMLYRACYELAMKTADCVIARGRHLAKLARKHNTHVIETVPLAHIQNVEPREPVELAPDEPRSILYVGLILKSKGLEDLMRALFVIKSRRPTPAIRLDVLGEGPDRGEFEALRDELGLTEDVGFQGWIEDTDELEGWFGGAQVVVMPTSYHQEGVPRVIDEALVRRIPVVATRIAGVPDEFAGGEVLLVDPAAPDQLADAIESILFDAAVRRRFIEGAERRRLHWARFSSAAEQHARLLTGKLASS